MAGRLRGLLIFAIALALAGCAASHGGGYYQHDGPPDGTDTDLSKIPDAKPRDAPPSKYGNPPSYTALGKRYYVLKSAAGFTQTGLASWYGRQFDGGRTSSGQPYNMFAMTAAHKRLPIPTWVRVTNLDNHRQVVVKINDRGPFHKDRIIDLSYAAARRLGIVGEGSAPVRIRTVTPETINQSESNHGPSNDNDTRVPLRRAENAAAESGGATTPAPSRLASQSKRSTTSDHSSTASAHAAAVAPLQIGAFSSAEHASQAKKRAHATGVGPIAVLSPSPHMKLYRVRVGPFRSLTARHEAARQLADAGFAVRKVKR